MIELDDWDNLAKEFLVGKKITNVFYTQQMHEEYLIPTIELDNKTLLYIQSDDEGNSSGTIHTNIKDHMILMPRKLSPKEI